MSWCSMIVCVIFFNVVVLVQSSNTASGLTLRRAEKAVATLARFQSTGLSEDSRDQTATNNSVGSQSPSIAEACNQISLANSRYQTAMHGIYEKLSSSYNCAGRQSYRRIGTSTYTYIYYDSYGIWAVGPSRCGNLVGIAVVSTATSPDKVTSTWLEYDGTSFVYSYSLQVRCDYSSRSSGFRIYARLIPAVIFAAIMPIALGV